MNEIRTRLAPSPTGRLHIGTARTALFNWLFAKKNGGKFILRIEDTDEERSKKEFEDDIIASLKWLGLEWDEFYRQSERKEIHRDLINKLLESDLAYVSKEDSQEGGRGEVIRFRNKGQKIKFNDVIRGDIELDTSDLGDFVIAKDMNTPVFHFAVVADDALMKITHVIRGEDHISNTPRQILIQEALGFPRPQYAHLPLMLGTDRSKLSKRHGAQSLGEYREMGYTQEAMFNFLALMGWHPAPEQSSMRGEPLKEKEIYSKDELADIFELERVQKSGAIFDTRKLDWISHEYIKKMSDSEFITYLEKFIPDNWDKDRLSRAIGMFKDRIHKLSDFKEEAKFIFEFKDYEPDLLIWKNSTKEKAIEHLNKISDLILSSGDIMEYANKVGRGDVLWPLRVSLSGLKNSPGPLEIMEALGKEESLARIKKAINKLNS